MTTVTTLTCKVDGCTAEATRKRAQMCNKHYVRARRAAAKQPTEPTPIEPVSVAVEPTNGSSHPKMMPLKYASVCTKCSTTLNDGDMAWYDRLQPKGRRVTCRDCHDKAARAATDPTPVAAAPEPVSTNGNGSLLDDATTVADNGGVTPEQAAQILAQVFGANGKDAELRGIVERLSQQVADHTQSIDEGRNRLDEISANVKSAVEDMLPPVVRIQKVEPGKTPEPPKGIMAHYILPKVLKVAAMQKRDGSRRNIMLMGPPGAGKSHLAKQVADALDLTYYLQEPVMFKYDLIGHKDVHNEYKPTPFYKAFKEGGVLLITEFDNSTAEALNAFNAAFANGHFMFPNGEMVTRHSDFVLIVDANTAGRGTDEMRTHVRRQLDAATLDRFCFLKMDYDEKLERELAIYEGGDTELTRSWVKRVQAMRAAAAQVGARIHVTPRASIEGAAYLAEGFPQDEVEDMTIWRDFDRKQREKIYAAMN